MLKKLNYLDKKYSKKIFSLDFRDPINYIIYASSLIYMEELGFFTVLFYHFFIFKSLKLTSNYLIILLVNVLITIFAKKKFNRTRPSDKELNKSTKTVFFRKKQCNGSFPSGDTIQAFAFVCFTFYYLESNLVFFFSLLIGIFIAFGRVYLCCHFIGDVTFGAFVGFLTSYIVVKVILENKSVNWIFSFLDEK